MDSATSPNQKYLDLLTSQSGQLLLLLSQKEKFVIERRFNLDNKKKSTLEEIGKHFSVTRERIRQIENNALQKLRRNIEKFEIFGVNDVAYSFLKESGGLMREDLLLSKILLQNFDQTASSLILVLSLDRRFKHIGNTIHFNPYFRVNEIEEKMVSDAADAAISYLKKKGDIVNGATLAMDVRKNHQTLAALADSSFGSLFYINKSFKVLEDKVGLQEWRHIHPRTLRDKIYFILRKSGSPMHFVDIANEIVNSSFDKKTLNMQAIHNELIRHGDFVLIGRGIYALTEWGFNHGTVSDVIAQILKGKEAMSEENIIAEVLKRRQVKPITIILNLKNKSQFVRVGRKHYALKA